MDIIPVVDVKEGIAVKAIAGNRSQYLPLDTPLAKSCKPEDLASGYYELFPFKTLYLADLDGIVGGQPNLHMQRRVREVWKGTNIWVDDGRVQISKKKDGMSYICGSEMFLTTGFCQTEDIKETLRNAGILSLDFRGDTFLGPPFLIEEISLWPETIIVMCLERVGCNRGPDLKKIEWVLQQAGSLKKIYAAGSIRNSEDLFSLKKSGVAGALIATALHDGQIKVGDLFKIAD